MTQEEAKLLVDRAPCTKAGYYHEAAKAYEKLAAIIRAYDYMERNTVGGTQLIMAINDARKIMGPQFQRNE